MKKPSHQLRNQLQFKRRLERLGVPYTPALMASWIEQQAIVVSVDRPDGQVEWCFGWPHSRWAPIQDWALAYFDP